MNNVNSTWSSFSFITFITKQKDILTVSIVKSYFPLALFINKKNDFKTFVLGEKLHFVAFN